MVQRTIPKVDPVGIVRWLGGMDLYELWKGQYQPKNGPRGLAPGEFYELTAYQLFRLLFKPPVDPDKPTWDHDPVALLKFANESRAKKGLPPVIPPHVLKDLPRG